MIEEIGKFLLEHADLVREVIAALARGTPKEAIRAAIRAAKIEVSDAAMREELGIEKPK